MVSETNILEHSLKLAAHETIIYCIGLGKTVIDGAGRIPFVGKFLENAGKNIFGSLPGIAEALRVFRDDPARIITTLQKTLAHGGSSLVRNI